MNDPERPPPARKAGFQIPDLELAPPVPSQRSAPWPTSAAPASKQVMRSGNAAGNSFDDDSFMLGTSADVELGGASAFKGVELDLGDEHGDFELERTRTPLTVDEGALPAAVSARGRATLEWPSGRSPEPQELSTDPAEVTLLADYGPTPSMLLLTPPYAWRVFSRQRSLKQQLIRLEAERRAVEGARDVLLAELARELRPSLDKDDRFQRLLTPLRDVDALAAQRSHALASTNASYAESVHALDEALAEIGHRRLFAESAHSEREKVTTGHEATFRRAEAKLKRVHIEARAIKELAAQKLGPQGGKIPEPEAKQLLLLEQRASAIQPEVDAASRELRTATSDLELSTRELNVVRREQRQVERQKQALAHEFQKSLSARSQNVNEAEEQQRSALADVGRAVLALGGGIAVEEVRLSAIRDADGQVLRAYSAADLHLRALDAFDRERAKQGELVLGTIGAVLLLLIVIKVIT